MTSPSFDTELLESFGLHRLCNRLVETVDDIGRRFRRREEAVPGFRGIAGHTGLRDRRQLRKSRRALGGGDGDRAELAGLHQRCGAGDRREDDMDLAAEQVGDRGRRALVRHCRELDAGHVLEQFAGQMRRGARAIGAVGQLVRLRLGHRDQVGDRFDRGRRIDHHQVERARDQRHRGEILVRVIGQLRVEARIDGIRKRSHQQRVTVRLGGCDRLGADDGAGARLVLDNDAAAEILRHFLRQRARDHVGAAARRKWHHDLDDAFGESGKGVAGECHEQQSGHKRQKAGDVAQS